jgi:transglutaminase-like putative cysteine protease
MKIQFPRSAVFPALFLLLLLPGRPVRAAADPYTGAKWALLDPAKVMAEAAQVTLSKYPDCDDATVEEKITETYQPDGTGGNQDEAFVKVLTEKGKRDRRTLTLGFLLPYFKVNVAKLEVIRPSGEVIPVDVAANSTVTIDDSQMEENIYDPNSKVLQVNIPDLEIGDVVHWITRTTTLRSIIPGEFADGNEFESTGYIRHLVWEVYAPLDKPLKKIVLKSEIPGTVKYTTFAGEEKTLVHRWEVSNVPRMFDEPSMPPYENVLQRALVSTTPDWREVSKWYWELSKPHLDATTPEMHKTVSELTANAKTDLDKARALFYYVSQKIRYMGLTPEQDRPGFEPHDVSMTFSKQYGVCRDKAALLVAMLREAGLNAYPVLVNVGSKKDKEVPDAGFNHAIVGVELKKGEYLLLDPTDEHARDFQPWYDGDQSYLVARPDGEDLRISSFKPPEENMMRIKTTGVLTAAGRLDAKSELWFGGANDDVYRNEFSNMKADDLRRYFEQYLKQAMPGARLTSLKLSPENMLDVSTPIKAEIEFSADDMTATGHGKSVVTVPWIGNDLGIVNRILEGAGLDKRQYPMQTRLACGMDEQVSLKLAGGFGAVESLPACPPVEDDCVSYHQTFDAAGGTLNCSRVLKLKQVEIAPDQYPELKKTLKALEYDARKSPVLAVADEAAAAPAGPIDPPATPPVESNTVVLYSHKEMDVTDAHSAVFHVKFARRILTYAGKIGQAEIKLDYNPACEDAEFIKGVVISKTGERQEISKGEINVMDSDWSASAKRYTGGKILVANLPGVDIGSTIEVEFQLVIKGKPYIGAFEPFQLPDDLQQKSFVLKAPAGLQIKKMVTGGVPLEAAAGAGKTGQTYEWTGKNIPALPAETELPPDWVYKPGVAYFVGDYNAYLKDLNDTLEDRAKSGAKAAELARELTAQCGSKPEAIKIIRDFVAKSIRLAGPTFTELPLSELSKADTTLADGYGHAADRAILLDAMLAAAGFQPRFVLASDLPAMDGVRNIARSFPLPDNFNTPLVKVAVNGETYYLNDTDQYARLGSTQHDDRLGIDLSSQAGEVIAAAKDCQDRIETDYTLSFANDGRLQMGVLKHYFGNEYNEKNKYFSELRPEEMKRYYQEVVSEIGQGARPVGGLTEQFNTYPGTEQFTVALDNYAVVDGKYLYFNLPFTPSLVKLPGGDQRSLPFMLSHEGTTSVRTEIELPLGFRDVLIAPRSESLQAPSGGGKVRMTSASTTGKLVLTDESETSPAVISPRDYPAMVKVESTLENKSSKVFLLEKE